MIRSHFIIPFTDHSWLRQLLDLQYRSIYIALKKYLNSLPLSQLQILDYGQGNRPYEKILSKARTYHTLDPHYPSTYKNVAEIDSLQRYDVIIIAEVLEHLADPRSTLQQLCNFLSPNGQIWISVPFNARIHLAPDDFWRFTPQGLSILVGNDFEILSLKPRGSDLASISTKINYYIFLRPWLLLLYLPIGPLLLVICHLQLLWGDERQKNFSQRCYHDPLGIVAILQTKKVLPPNNGKRQEH